MTSKDIKEFKEYVAEQLMKQYHMNEFSAKKAVRNSYLIIALKVDAESAMHDSVEYWAEYIYNNELNQRIKEM